MVVPLQYARVDIALRKPWYVWLGAAMAAGWLATWGTAAAAGIVLVCLHGRHDHPDGVLILVLLALALLTCAMALILEWRAIFRRSANASAMLGLLLAFPALLATLAEAQAVLRHEKTVAIVDLGVLVSSLGFCVWSHFQWARLITNWLTDSLRTIPSVQDGRSGGGPGLPAHPPACTTNERSVTAL